MEISLKLEIYFDRIIFADVYLKVQKTSEKENKIVEILLNVPGDELIVKKDTLHGHVFLLLRIQKPIETLQFYQVGIAFPPICVWSSS